MLFFSGRDSRLSLVLVVQLVEVVRVEAVVHRGLEVDDLRGECAWGKEVGEVRGERRGLWVDRRERAGR